MTKKEKGKLHFCPNCEHEWRVEKPPYWNSGFCPSCKKVVTFMFPVRANKKVEIEQKGDCECGSCESHL